MATYIACSSQSQEMHKQKRLHRRSNSEQARDGQQHSVHPAGQMWFRRERHTSASRTHTRTALEYGQQHDAPVIYLLAPVYEAAMPEPATYL
jgi:hypothetical protein